VGRKPIAAVATVMIVNVRISVDLRPIRSPRWPATNAPIGRARKPTPNEASETICAMAGGRSGKKSWPKTSAAAVP
jgi:hypothetical protein